MSKSPTQLKKDPVVNAALTVAEYVIQFQIASVLEDLCEGNPNKENPGMGRFDMKNISVEAALQDERFIGAVKLLDVHKSQPNIPRILNALYAIAPQAQDYMNNTQ